MTKSSQDARSSFGFDASFIEGAVIARVAGELDIGEVSALNDRLLELVLTDRPVILDLAEVTFLDSSALGAIITMQRQLEKIGQPLYLASLRPNVRSVFEITALDKFMSIHETEQDALRAARESSESQGP